MICMHTNYDFIKRARSVHLKAREREESGIHEKFFFPPLLWLVVYLFFPLKVVDHVKSNKKWPVNSAILFLGVFEFIEVREKRKMRSESVVEK